MQHLALTSDWALSLDGRSEHAPASLVDRVVPATVPGCVHTDLLAAGLIDDPYMDRNELDQLWIGRCDWRYQTSFTLDAVPAADHRLDLVCEGLDTLATVEVNGQVVGRADNMHRSWRFDLRAVAKAGVNTLAIRLAAPLTHIEALERSMPTRPHAGSGSNPLRPFHLIRKMACNFGWDWGPALPTCGIWRPIRIESWSSARLASVRPLITACREDHADIEVQLDVERDASAILRAVASLYDPHGQLVEEATVPLSTEAPTVVALRVPRPRRWWPVGYGEQPLYRLHARVVDPQGRTLDEKTQRLGLRSVELCTDPDPQPVGQLGQGATFHLRINGQRIYCKGANWIPDDCFVHRVTPERYRRRVEQAVEANMNMLRVWGGGIYEDHAFYEACDERGVLVWQDFCCACACYPEEQPFYDSFEAEARENVARLSHHPSLVLWCGNNECIQATFHWGENWRKTREQGKITWGLGYYLGLFPKVMAELDPTRPYWPGSPYSGSMQVEPNVQSCGDVHLWDVWNGQGDYMNYLAHAPRFASEFGFHGPPAWPTLTDAIPADQRAWTSPAMIHHNKHAGGQQTATARIRDRFDLPEDASFEDTVFLAAINQARALTVGCEWFRALSPWCSGALYWQLNDCWPVSSWSAIDGQGRPKLMWYATRRFFQPRLVTIMPTRPLPQGQPLEALSVYLHNDHADRWAGQVTVRRMTIQGRELDAADWSFAIEPRGSQRIDLPDSWTGDPGELLLAEVDDAHRGWWFFGSDRDIAYPTPRMQLDLQRQGDTYQLTVRAESLIRELCLLADRIDRDAVVSDQLVHLLPGESFTFHIRSRQTLTLEALSAPDVLRCCNPLGRSPATTSAALA